MRYIVVTLLCSLFWSLTATAQDTIPTDSTQLEQNKKELRKDQRKQARKELKPHFSFNFFVTNASINSSARFEERNGIFSALIDLENHFGLDDRKMIWWGSFVYRITPRSGINAFYYQLNRGKDHTLQRDIVFQGDTIEKGQLIGGYFNVSIFSFGYLFTVISEKKSFFALFANLYLANLKVGVKSDAFKIEKSSQYYAATPNFGLLIAFKITKWFMVGGKLGLFFLTTKDWSGTLHDIQVTADFKPLQWLAIGVGYQVFDVKFKYPEDRYTAYLNYNISGPTIGLKFRF